MGTRVPPNGPDTRGCHREPGRVGAAAGRAFAGLHHRAVHPCRLGVVPWRCRTRRGAALQQRRRAAWAKNGPKLEPASTPKNDKRPCLAGPFAVAGRAMNDFLRPPSGSRKRSNCSHLPNRQRFRRREAAPTPSSQTSPKLAETRLNSRLAADCRQSDGLAPVTRMCARKGRA